MAPAQQGFHAYHVAAVEADLQPLRPVLDEAFSDKVSQKLIDIGKQSNVKDILASIAEDFVSKLRAKGLFAHAGNDDSGLTNLVNLPFLSTDTPGLSVLNSGRTNLFFNPNELAKATIHQKSDNVEGVYLPVEAVKNILAYAILHNKTNEVLQALNRFIDLQFTKPDHQV